MHQYLLIFHFSLTTVDNESELHNNIFVPIFSSIPSDQSLYSEKPVEQWDGNDVYQWFDQNHIRAELRDICQFEDGHELLDYAKIFLNTKELQYQLYSNEFLRKDGIGSSQKPLLLHEFTKFSNALRKLMINKSTS